MEWTASGRTYEAVPRQHGKLLSERGLESAKALVTQVARPTPEQLAHDVQLEQRKVSHFRGLAARSDYLAVGCPDRACSAKGVCRWMSAPMELGFQSLKRLAKYLAGKLRLVWE